MKLLIQVISNNPLQKVPSILINAENFKYIWNIPEHFNRFIEIHHLTNLKPPIAVFFTKACINSMGGLIPFLAEGVKSRLSANASRFYVRGRMYDYMRELRYKLGVLMLPYSYFNLDTGLYQLGLHDEN